MRHRALRGLALALLLVSGSIIRSHAQGTIVFNNLANSDPSPSAQSGGLVYMRGPSGWGLLNADINFELFGGVTLPSLQPIHTWLISDGSARGIAIGGGYIADPSAGTYVIPGAAAGGDAILLILAWAGNYDNWDAATRAGTPIAATFFYNPVGGGAGPPASLVGMPALGLASIPEPSLLALLVAGAVALLAWKRKAA